ncbi:MAG: hypothetical protein KDB14_24745, partial [Planctomycetales bacterium]|nr:hypothetical protein [Planctomycetales bacterium]
MTSVRRQLVVEPLEDRRVLATLAPIADDVSSEGALFSLSAAFSDSDFLQDTISFNFTGGTQAWEVPTGVSVVT